MKQLFPTKDIKRITALELLTKRSAQADKKLQLLLPYSTEECNATLISMKHHFANVAGKLSEQARCVRVKNEARTTARLYLHNYLVCFKLAVGRGEYAPQELALFTLKKHQPEVYIGHSDRDVLVWGGVVLSGIANMKRKGLPLLNRPDEADVIAHFKAFVKAHTAVQVAKNNVQDARDALATVRAQVDEFIKDVVASVKHHYRKLSKPELRDVLRRWGVQFKRKKKAIKTPSNNASNNTNKKE